MLPGNYFSVDKNILTVKDIFDAYIRVNLIVKYFIHEKISVYNKAQSTLGQFSDINLTFYWYYQVSFSNAKVSDNMLDMLSVLTKKYATGKLFHCRQDYSNG